MKVYLISILLFAINIAHAEDGCKQIAKARQECAVSGNYGQCLLIKLDWVFNQLYKKRGIRVDDPNDARIAIEGYYKENCLNR